MLKVIVALMALAMAMPCRAEENVIAVIYQDGGMNNAVSIEESCPAESESDVELADAPAINDISSALDEADKSREYLGVYYVTRYCSCRKCSGKWGTTSASGKPLIPDYSCASPLPFGTVVEIDGYGRCEVVDRTSDKTARRTGGKIIDIYTSNHAEAEAWGCKKLQVWRCK